MRYPKDNNEDKSKLGNGAIIMMNLIQYLETNTLDSLTNEELYDLMEHATQEELSKLLEKETPYESKPWHTVPIIKHLLTQWITYNDTWEVYPMSRKDLFLAYKNRYGTLPDPTIPTMALFNQYTAAVC
jgi:hypothetical protein